MTTTSDRAKDDENEANQVGEKDENGKENNDLVDAFCYECKCSLAKSRELINITGQSKRRWHPECFRCMVCREPMDKRQSCHVYKDQILCRSDYLRLKKEQAVTCKRCQWPIGASDWVRRAGEYVYHLACFNCDICFRQLNTGEQFVINTLAVDAETNASSEIRAENHQAIRLMCKLHFTVDSNRHHRESEGDIERTREREIEGGSSSPGAIKPSKQEFKSSISFHCKQRQRNHQTLKSDHYHLLTSSNAPSSSSSIIGLEEPMPDHQSQQRTQFAQAVANSQPTNKDFSIILSSPPSSNLMIDDNYLGRHHQIPSSSSSSTASSSSATNMGCTPESVVATVCGGSGLQSKSKRVRTTFTEDQLSILQTHFQIDSNPDGQDLERIATITGLSKRVTQVWFQNSRARQKKYMIKRKPTAGSMSNSSISSLNLALDHQRQHGVHPNLGMMGRTMSSSNETTPSPNMEIDRSPADQSNVCRHEVPFSSYPSQIEHGMAFAPNCSRSDTKSSGESECESSKRQMALASSQFRKDEASEDDESGTETSTGRR